MKIIKKIKSIFHDDWCKNCLEEMKLIKKELYYLPQTVGNYTSHKSVDYYKKNLIKVNKKSEIPTGYYACGILKYHCPTCNFNRTKLSIFLPVRGIEKLEENIYYENGEFD